MGYNKHDELPSDSKLSLWKELWYPMILILFTGVIGVGVTYTWEYFKFKRETVFERKMDYIIDSRDEAAKLYVSIDNVRRVIRSQENDKWRRRVECNHSNFKGQVEELKSYALRVNYLSDFSKGIISGDSIVVNVKQFKETLKSYLKCLKENESCQCTNKHTELMSPLKNIIYLHTKELNEHRNQ